MTTTTFPEGSLEGARDIQKPVDEEEFERVWQDEKGFWGVLTAVQNSPIGMRFIATAFVFFLIGGITSLLMRTQLAVPENTFLTPKTYNQLMTMHGTTMMFLFSIPLLEGLGALVLPQMLGGRELPYPRLSAFAYWTTLFGGVIFYLSFVFGLAPDGGWYAYVPLTNIEFSPDRSMDFWLLGLNVAEIGAIAGAFELIITVLKVRGIGMSINRLPVFAWAMLVIGVMILFAFTPLIVGSTLLELDRKLHTQFFNPDMGGKPLLWQHLFWIFGHPDVYIQFLPAVGMVSMIIPVFVRHKIEGYTYIILGIMAIGFISFGLWAHHMFTAGLPQMALALFSAASMTIAIPSGIQVFAWLATIWNGRPVWRTPFLFICGFLFIFVLGGLSGVMVAVVPFDWQVTDSYFVVAHFHYVLIGGMVFPIFAALYYWWPRYMEKLLDERLGAWNFWLMFIGFNVAFFPMHLSGFLGMARRVYTYSAGTPLDILNLISTIGAFMVALGVLLFVINVFYTQIWGKPAPNNPWGADTLEWAPAQPMPLYGFRVLPVVRSRHPLWDQKNLEASDERTNKLVQAFAHWPTRWRSQIATTTLDARPQEIFRVPGPSIWPFVAAVSLTALSVALIFDEPISSVISVLVTIVALIAWHWPDKIDREGDTRAADAFEKEHGVAVNIEGSVVIARWAIWLTMLTLAIALGSLLFCYFYLRLDAPAWPPTGVTLPNPFWPLLGSGLLLSSALPQYMADRAIRNGARGRFMVLLAVGFVLAALGFALALYGYAQTPFRWDEHAYGSAFYVLAFFQLAIALTGLIMNGFAQFWAWQGHYSARYHQSIENVSTFGIFVAATSLIVAATLYGAPYIM
jgi:cytochrome c oxidase subunit I+III